MRPVYGVVPSDPMDETIAENLKGYRERRPGSRRQRRGRADAARHLWQHHPRRDAHVLRPEVAATGRQRAVSTCSRRSAHKAAELAFTPDAGIWEYRGRTRVHTYSAAMCWAGCSRLAAIASHLGLSDRAAHWPKSPTASNVGCLKTPGATSAARSRRRSVTMTSMQACCCCPRLGLIEPDDPRYVRTVEASARSSLRGQSHDALHQRGRFRPAGSPPFSSAASG